MPPIMLDLGIAVLILGMTYALMSEGLWGAALMFFNVLFAGLIAFNFYEPLAALLAENVSQMANYADTLCLMGLFTISLLLLRLTTESIAPGMVRFPTPVYHVGRVLFGFAASALTMSILLLAFHTSPVHRKMLGAIDYEYQPPFKQGLDRKWLAFFQFTTGQVFATYSDQYSDPRGEFRNAKVFDPAGSWLIDHQNARPYPADNQAGKIPEPPSAAEGAPAGGAGSEAGAPGGQPGMPGGQPGMPGGQPGMPGPNASQPGPGIPGGTAGAAAGLAPTVGGP